MDKISPCKDCLDRIAGCHDKCVAYKNWVESIRQLKREKSDWKNTRARLTLDKAKTKHSAAVLRNRGRR